MRVNEGGPVLSGWGRWGEDDEAGTFNLLTPSRIVDAARIVKRGVVYRLSLPLHRDKVPTHPTHAPPLHFMTLDGGDYAAGAQLPGGARIADDYIFMPCHCGTHVDGLGHSWSGDLLYNGHSAHRVRSYGATRCGIENLPWIVGRGVLLDMARWQGQDRMAAGSGISGAEIDACAAAQQVEIRSGDSVLIRTGWWKLFSDHATSPRDGSPGLGIDGAKRLAELDVCLVGADNTAVEVTVSADVYEDGSRAPLVHPFLLRDRGIYLIELLDLERLAADNVYEFMFVTAPLPIVGGTGSPVSPLAIA